MTLRIFSLGFAFLGLLSAAKDTRRIGTATYSNDNVEISATAYLDKDSIRDVLGAPLDDGYCVVKLTVTPKTDDKLRVDRDDFTLLSFKDGQKAQPFEPSQIAGSVTMVVATQSDGGGGSFGGGFGPIWGGSGGGQPRRAGPVGPADSSAKTSADSDGQGRKNPLLAILTQKIFPDKETSAPVTGLLYFPLDGKHKGKDLTLLYKGPAGRFSVDFH